MWRQQPHRADHQHPQLERLGSGERRRFRQCECFERFRRFWVRQFRHRCHRPRRFVRNLFSWTIEDDVRLGLSVDADRVGRIRIRSRDRGSSRRRRFRLGSDLCLFIRLCRRLGCRLRVHLCCCCIRTSQLSGLRQHRRNRRHCRHRRFIRLQLELRDVWRLHVRRVAVRRSSVAGVQLRLDLSAG